MACSSLPPLVRQGRMPGTNGASVLVYDNALFKSSAAAAQPVAFDGAPAPQEADGDTQMFYYYYDDDADDSQVSCRAMVLRRNFGFARQRHNPDLLLLLLP
jgi:hypothetical protein